MTTIADLQSRILDRGIRKSYSIAFTPRCGSTALTHLLTDAALGNPTEYFQYPYESSEYWNWLPGETVAERFVELVDSYQGAGMFGSKVAHDHRAYLEGRLEMELGAPVSMDEVLPGHGWLYMYRRDLIDQAISAYIARSSGVWHVKQGDAIPDSLVADYDFLAIFAQIHVAMAAQFHWETYFKHRVIEPFRIAYEDFIADEGETLAEIRAFLGLEPRSAEAAGASVQTNRPEQMSSRWPEKYAELRGRFLNDLLDWGKDSLWERQGQALERWGNFFINRGWE